MSAGNPKYSPLLFKGPLVRAIFADTKTMTRRLIDPPPMMVQGARMVPWDGDPAVLLQLLKQKGQHCPYGGPGDRIWVRETWQGPLVSSDEAPRLWRNPAPYQQPAYCEYAADGGPTPEYLDSDENLRQGWRPSIHMPRWACRLELEIVDVRVERLQAISDADIVAEGTAMTLPDGRPFTSSTPRQRFADLWDSTGGSWLSNPWVWVITFKRLASLSTHTRATREAA
jgi:hypothetical protein